MGMFDYVNVKIPCPACGEIVTGFQSKDGDCLLDKIDPEQVGTFHSYCICGEHVRMSREWQRNRIICREEPFTLEELRQMGFEYD